MGSSEITSRLVAQTAEDTGLVPAGVTAARLAPGELCARAPLIARIPSGSPGSRWLIRPERGPRAGACPPSGRSDGLRPLSPLLGGYRPDLRVETHQRWDAVRHAGGRAELRSIEAPSWLRLPEPS